MLNQNTSDIGVKNFSSTYKALGDYDINQIYVEKESLELRGLKQENLLPLTWEDEDEDWTEKDSIQVVSSEELGDIIDKQDIIFNF
jgi:tRNA 2-thiouridine synthesizing protein C